MFRRHVRGTVYITSVAAAIAVLSLARPHAQQAAPLPSARQVIDRYVQAAGGASAFKAVKSIRGRGKLSIPSQNLSGEVEMMAARPNKSLTRVTVQGVGKLEEGYDGRIGWSLDPISGPALVTGRALTDRADEAWFDAPLHGTDFVRDLKMVGREDFDRRPAYRVNVILVSGGEQSELFDVETGLQIGLEAKRDTPLRHRADDDDLPGLQEVRRTDAAVRRR